MKTELQKSKLNPVIVFSMLIFVVLFVAILAIALTQNPNDHGFQLQNKPAPDFLVKNLKTNGPLSYAQLKGKPIILNFWASWCESCRMEALELEKFHRTYGQQIHVVGIAIQDEFDDATSFAKRYGKTYALGLDENGRANTDYGITGVPETFFISSEGILLEKITGPVRFDEMISLKEKFKW